MSYFAGSLADGTHTTAAAGLSSRASRVLTIFRTTSAAESHAALSANTAVIPAGCRQKLMPMLALELITTIRIHWVIALLRRLKWSKSYPRCHLLRWRAFAGRVSPQTMAGFFLPR